MRDKLLLGDRAPFLERHKGSHHLAPVLIRDAYCGGFHYLLMGIEYVLDLTRPDLVATYVDHVLLAVHYVEPPLVVHDRHVPCEEVLVVERFFSLLGLVPI